jgi:hypothetical protein
MSEESGATCGSCGGNMKAADAVCPQCGGAPTGLSPGAFWMTVAAAVFCLAALVYSLYALIGE